VADQIHNGDKILCRLKSMGGGSKYKKKKERKKRERETAFEEHKVLS